MSNRALSFAALALADINLRTASLETLHPFVARVAEGEENPYLGGRKAKSLSLIYLGSSGTRLERIDATGLVLEDSGFVFLTDTRTLTVYNMINNRAAVAEWKDSA